MSGPGTQAAVVHAGSADVPADLVDLVCADVGGEALCCSDDFFAPSSCLVQPGPAVWDEHRYTDHGKWMDGWESRRRRGPPGHDWCLLRLGLPGRIERIVVDTSWFKGNQPESCSLEVCNAEDLPAEVLAAGAVDDEGEPVLDGLWTEILPRSVLDPHTVHTFAVSAAAAALAFASGRATHARLRIFPDGGVARLRLMGRADTDVAALARAGDRCDLASLRHGGQVLGYSNAFFSAPANLLQPARSRGMHDGWETRRRRGPGHDWVVISLGAAGRIDRVEVDTSHFKGNAPGHCALWISDEAVPAERHGDEPGPSSSWRPLLGPSPLRPDDLHVFEPGALESGEPESGQPGAGEPASDEGGGLTGTRRGRYVRFDTHPDGGVARLRLFGEADEVAGMRHGLERLDAASESDGREALWACCGCAAFVDAMLSARPFGDPGALLRRADEVLSTLGPDDWREAFAAHPEIGASASPTARGATPADAPHGAGDPDRHAQWSAAEQASTGGADADILRRLADGNRAYRKRFGHSFIVCATGRRPAEMLALLERRLSMNAGAELAVAAENQRRITQVRLMKLMGEP